MIKYGIVIPCFNEAQRLKRNSFKEFLLTHPEYLFVFVNDGSTDNTSLLLNDMAASNPKNIKFLNLDKNKGKAEAIRLGVNSLLKNPGINFVGYWDADLSTPLTELPRFIELLKKNKENKFLMGARIKRLGANVKRSEARHYLGRIFATAVSVLFKLPVYDTQCGAKIMHIDLARIIFKEKFISRWLFDVELIARILSIYGYGKTINCVVELPLLTWVDDGQSKVKIVDFLRTPFELIQIKSLYKRYIK